MGTYDTMKNCLQKTGIYRLDGKTAVDFELQAYAAGLDPLVDAFKQLKQESFVATASDYGLRFREVTDGIVFPPGDVEGRRKILYAVGAITPNCCTKADLQNLLDAFGFDAQVLEDLPGHKLTVRILKSPPGWQDTWENIIGRFLPAHIPVTWEYPAKS